MKYHNVNIGHNNLSNNCSHNHAALVNTVVGPLKNDPSECIGLSCPNSLAAFIVQQCKEH